MNALGCRSKISRGRLAAVAKALADAKVNIEAILAVTAGAQGSAQLVVDNVAKAKKALSAAQFGYTEGTLDRVELPNKAVSMFTPFLANFAAKSVSAPTVANNSTDFLAPLGKVP